MPTRSSACPVCITIWYDAGPIPDALHTTAQKTMTKDATPLVCLADYEKRAEQVLSPETWAYIHSGAADQHTFARNQQAFADIQLAPRHLCAMQGGHT